MRPVMAAALATFALVMPLSEAWAQTPCTGLAAGIKDYSTARRFVWPTGLQCSEMMTLEPISLELGTNIAKLRIGIQPHERRPEGARLVMEIYDGDFSLGSLNFGGFPDSCSNQSQEDRLWDKANSTFKLSDYRTVNRIEVSIAGGGLPTKC